MNIKFTRAELGDFETLQGREWIETNGLGGWASSTLSGAHTRRYHGLLVAAVQPPARRMVLVSKLDESIVRHGNRYELGSNQYHDTVYPQGHQYLHSFSHNIFPSFEYHIDGIELTKTIVSMHSENTTLVIYEVTRSPGVFLLELTPLLAGRGYHELAHHRNPLENSTATNQDIAAFKPFPEMPETFIRVPKADFSAEPDWYYHFEYSAERQRGYDYDEDLYCPGRFMLTLKEGEKLGIIISTVNPEGRDPFKLFQAEQTRRSALVEKAPRKDEFAISLHLAADQFLVDRHRGLRSILAGYHWFTDWGRDAMISLPGLCLVPGKFEDAKRVILAFTEKMNHGMLPNNFADDNTPAGYNSVDGTLWYFIALYKYYQYTKDSEFISGLMPVLQDVIDWYVRGTRFDIRVDDDGLLAAGNPAVQVTWMDAKVGDWVVTPRNGKAVEVNALWYNALCIMEFFCGVLEERQDQADFAVRARVVKERFNEVFWNGEAECLFDCIDGSSRDNRIRPNQIFALSLPFPLLSSERALKVLQIVERRLYTPFGLRTLDPAHPGYQGRYSGTQQTRDAAYHQGTVWSWLLGPFITAMVRLEGPAGQRKAMAVIDRFRPHLREAGIGTVSEIFDGDEPFSPRGSIAQAWSVAEILRAYTEDILGKIPR